DLSYFEGNIATGRGGAVEFTGTSLDINRSTFDSNFAQGHGADGDGGGAVWVGTDAWCSIANSTFANNGADNAGLGGALHLSEGAAGGSIIYSTFASNSTLKGGFGGGVYTAARSLDLGASIFCGNVSTYGFDIFRSDSANSADIASAGYNIVANYGCTSGDGTPRSVVDWTTSLTVSAAPVGPGLTTDLTGSAYTRSFVFGTHQLAQNIPAFSYSSTGPFDYFPAGTGDYTHELFTIALASASPAKDKINDSDSYDIFSYYTNNNPNYLIYRTDERGVMRNVLVPEPTGGLLSDIGAYEFEGEMDGRVYVTMSEIPNNMARIGQLCSLSASLNLPGQLPILDWDFVWRSSDPNVAAIGSSTGNLYSLSIGTTTISVSETMYGTAVSRDLVVSELMQYSDIEPNVMANMANFNESVIGGAAQVYFTDSNPDDIATTKFRNAYLDVFSLEPQMLVKIGAANAVDFKVKYEYGDAVAFKPSVSVTANTLSNPGAVLPLSFVFTLGWDEVGEILGKSGMTSASTTDVRDIFRRTLGFVFVDGEGNATTLIDGDGSAGVDVSDALAAGVLSHSGSGNNLRLQLDVMLADVSPIGERGAALIEDILIVADNNPNGKISGELWLLKDISHYDGDGSGGGGGCGTGAAALLLLVSAAALRPIVRGGRNKIDKDQR
ncbi:MAG: hypothetical protein LBS93_03710, partial [Synergistaceae bacterium]|nr:hypothetical protein [Synergistaceae bacterium]